MKVLFVSSGNSEFGISPIVKNQGESLRQNGIDLDYFTIKGRGIKGYLKNIPILKKHLNTNHYDIIHAHYGLTGLISVLTMTSKPLVLSIMGDDAYGSFNIKGKRIAKSYFKMFLTQLTILFPKYLIVKSNNILRYIPYNIKTSVIPNGVDFDIFKPMDKEICRKDLNLPLNNKLILFLANPEDSRKNFKLLQKALLYLNEKNYKIINPYPITHEHTPKYFNACDVFVLSSYNEGSPNVIKEAMACNLPIVSTDVGDVKEIIGDTEGCYITSFDPKDVAEKIEMALSFGKRTNGRERIKQLGLDSDTIAKKIIEIYRQIPGRSKNKFFN